MDSVFLYNQEIFLPFASTPIYDSNTQNMLTSIERDFDLAQSSWLALSLLLVFVLFCLIVANSRKTFSDSLFFFHEKKTTLFTIHIEDDPIYKLFLSLISIFSMGFFLFKITAFLFPTQSEHYNWIWIYAVIIVGYFLFKALFLYIIGQLFMCSQHVKTFISYTFSLLSYGSIFLFPLAICSIYLSIIPFKLWILLFLLTITYGMFLIIFKLFNQNTISFFYLLLYLCTFEILPIFLVIKFISTNYLIV